MARGRKRQNNAEGTKSKQTAKIVSESKERPKYVPREEYNPRESTKKIIHTSLTNDAIRRLINLGFTP